MSFFLKQKKEKTKFILKYKPSKNGIGERSFMTHSEGVGVDGSGSVDFSLRSTPWELSKVSRGEGRWSPRESHCLVTPKEVGHKMKRDRKVFNRGDGLLL